MLNYIFVLFIISISLSCEKVTGESSFDVRDISNYAYKLGLILYDLSISHGCKIQLLKYGKGLQAKEEWALRMFDAQGKLQSGVLEGNFNELGSFEECLEIENESIVGQYCLASIYINSSSQSSFRKQIFGSFHTPKILEAEDENEPVSLQFRLGMCVPSTCSHTDLQLFFERISGAIRIEEKFCQTKFSRPKLDNESIAVLYFFGVILSLMIISTICDAAFISLKKDTTTESIWTAFSIIANGRKIFKTEENDKNQISCLYGLRVISMMWIVLAHRYLYQNFFPVRNAIAAIDILNNQRTMFLIQAPLAVDTFFVMSGLVTSYVHLVARFRGKKFNILLFYTHRYLRLTPLLAAALLIYLTLLQYLGSGPLWPRIYENLQPCRDTWWKTLLYVQNYGNTDNMCMPHTWYLSVDMQLFIISPILLIPLARWPKISFPLIGLLSSASILANFCIAWHMELRPFVIIKETDKLSDYLHYYYFPAYTRVTPWLVGLFVGYMIFEAKYKKHIVLKKSVCVFLWMVCLSVLPVCVFGGHQLLFGEPRRMLSSLHIAFVRPAWAIAIGWLVYACANGYGGPINWFLSLPIFQMVSKLTYSMYLIHSFILGLIVSQIRAPFQFSNTFMFYIFWADFVCILVVAVIFTLAFELPMNVIEKYLLGNGTFDNRKGKPNRQML